MEVFTQHGRICEAKNLVKLINLREKKFYKMFLTDDEDFGGAIVRFERF
jgi:hypothetical protein